MPLAYDCPACNEDQDLEVIREEIRDGFVFIYFGGCGHGIVLETLEESVAEQRKVASKRIDWGRYGGV